MEFSNHWKKRQFQSCLCEVEMIYESWELEVYDILNGHKVIDRLTMDDFFHNSIFAEEFRRLPFKELLERLFQAWPFILPVNSWNAFAPIKRIHSFQDPFLDLWNFRYFMAEKHATSQDSFDSLHLLPTTLREVRGEMTDSCRSLPSYFSEQSRKTWKNGGWQSSIGPAQALGWEPVLLIQRLQHFAQLWKAHLERSLEKKRNYEIALCDELKLWEARRLPWEHHFMAQEDRLGQLQIYREHIYLEQSRIQQVMRFVRRLEVEVAQEEKFEKEDWRRAYDDLEDGSGWKSKDVVFVCCGFYFYYYCFYVNIYVSISIFDFIFIFNSF